MSRRKSLMPAAIAAGVLLLVLSGCDALVRISTDPSGALPEGPGDDPVFHLALTGDDQFDVLAGSVSVSLPTAQAAAGANGGTVFNPGAGEIVIDEFDAESGFGRTLVVRQAYPDATTFVAGDDTIRYRVVSTLDDGHIRLQKSPQTADSGASSALQLYSASGSSHEVTYSGNELFEEGVLSTFGFGGSQAREAFFGKDGSEVHRTDGYNWTRAQYEELDRVEIEIREAEVEITDIMLFDYALTPEQVGEVF